VEKKINFKNISVLVLTYLFGCISSFILLYRKDISIKDIQLLLSKDTYIEDVQVTELTNDTQEVVETVTEPIQAPESICVDVSGAVKNPGVYCLEEGSLMVDALKKAGGFVAEAGYKYISMNLNLSSKLKSSSKIYIPYIKDLYCETVEFELPSKIVKVIQPIETEVEEEGTPACININSATKEQLDSLPGVGPSTAQKIIDARPFTSIEGIKNVSGIGDSTYNEIKEKICI
jgi:competence protein ComEA